MKSKEKLFDKSSQLRKKAELALFDIQHQESTSLNEIDSLKLIHELEVHMIELELQNHDLEKSLEDIEAAKALYEFSPSGYFTLDSESTILALNFSAAHIIGKSRSELINQKFNAYIAQEDLGMYNSFLTSVYKTESKQVAELRLAIAGHPLMYVHVEGVIFNQPLQCLVTVIDITRQKLLENSLKESEDKLFKKNELLSKLLENLQVGVFMVESPSGKPLLANAKAFDLLGRGILVDASAKNLSEIYKVFKLESREPYPPQEMPILKAITGESSYVDDMLVKRPDGSEVVLEVFGTPVKDKDDKIWASLVSFSDITKRKESEKKLKENEVRLEQINHTKDKFFNIIAHDLRNPFNSIMGLSEVLIERIRDNNLNDLGRIGELIYSSSNNAFNLLSNLLEWAQLQTGRIEFRPEIIDINSLIQEIIDVLSETAKQKSIKFELQLPYNTSLFADKEMIATIIRNLISNAIKFSFEGDKIVLSARESNNEFQLIVSDNGTGMSEEAVSNLFCIEEVYSTKGTKNEKGTGLGLILCKEFVAH
ncbi:MAG: PAS domain-containing sensor histidine kinase, partial [Bacteroidales bacterium]|nr:PAS domain-containing sensor histidine kinase [Bacteroidales bacterium]